MLLLLPVALLLQRRQWWAARDPARDVAADRRPVPVVFAAASSARCHGLAPRAPRARRGSVDDSATTGAILAVVTAATTPDLDPPCPGAPAEPVPGAATHRTSSATRSVPSTGRSTTIAPATWDALADATPWATPFSRWGFQRAWWDAYGANAHDQTLVVVDDAAPDDAAPDRDRPAHAPPRGGAGRRDPPHADARGGARRPADARRAGPQGRLLRGQLPRRLRDGARPAGGPAGGRPRGRGCPRLRRDRGRRAPRTLGRRSTCDGCAAATRRPTSWQRRSGRTSPRTAGRWSANARRSARSSTSRPASDFEGYLGTLGKKERHEVRRKIRRAEAAGEVRLERSTDPIGRPRRVRGPAPAQVGRERALPADARRRPEPRLLPRPVRALRPGRPPRAAVPDRRRAGGSRPASGSTTARRSTSTTPAWTRTRATCRRACSWSPARSRWRCRPAGRGFDFLRGDEPYKYGWGATDVPIQRLLVVRNTP